MRVGSSNRLQTASRKFNPSAIFKDWRGTYQTVATTCTWLHGARVCLEALAMPESTEASYSRDCAGLIVW